MQRQGMLFPCSPLFLAVSGLRWCGFVLFSACALMPSGLKAMRKLAWLFLVLSPLAAVGESMVEIPADQCVWRAGDDLAWAAPNLDEGAWRLYGQLNLQPDDVHAWVRCHLGFSSLRDVAHPAIQVTLAAACL